MKLLDYRRRQMIIDKKFQVGVSFRIVVFLASYMLFFCLVSVFMPFISGTIAGGTEDAMIDSVRRIIDFTDWLLIPLVLTFVCLTLHGILLTHRVAGPAYRLERTLKSMRQGDLSIDIRLRKRDYLASVADAYNEMIVPLRQDVARLRQTVASLIDQPNDPDDVRQAGNLMAEILDRYTIDASRAPVAEECEAEKEPVQPQV